MKKTDALFPTQRSLHVPLRPVALALLLVVLLGAGLQGCLFLDVLTGLYTGTYAEFSACKLDEEGNSCATLRAAHDACVAEKGVGHAECRVLFKSVMDCAFCDFFYAESYLSSSAASKRATQVGAASAAVSPELFWTQGASQVFRTANGGASVEEIFDAGRWPLGVAVDAGAGKIYWTDGRTHSLRRADLDGSNVEDLVTDLYGSGLALDAASQMLYIGNASDGTIERLNLSTLAKDILITDVFSPVDLAFDPTSSTLYWTQNGPSGGSIQSLDTSGSGSPQPVVTGLTLPFGLALDPAAGMLYWSDLGDNAIRNVDLSNPGAVNDVLTGLDRPGALVLDGSGGMLYWADAGTAQLKSATLADPVNTMQTLNGFTAVADLALDVSSDQLYWTGWVSGTLMRSDVDGSAFQVLVFPQSLDGDLALDATRQKVYWAVSSTGVIQRADLDGANVEDVIGGQFGLGAVAFDPVGDKVYWTGSGDVLRADPDGANVETILTGIVFIGDLEIDAQAGKLYWTNRESIQRSNLDGTGAETFYTDTNLVDHLALHDGILYWSLAIPGVIRRVALDGSTGLEDVVTGINFVRQIDITGDKLYWTIPSAQTVQRSNLDGSGVEDILTNAKEITGLVTEDAAVLPVELTRFDATADGLDVQLHWTTASETNNAGFDIQHAAVETLHATSPQWHRVAFVDGHGTTSDPQFYTFHVRDLAAGIHRFRLKQIDFDGTFSYGPEVEVTVELAEAFALSPAYPNPFNPQARFTLTLREPQHVQVAVYDALGRRVARLHDGSLEAHRAHTFTMDGGDWTAGIYFYEVAAERFRTTRSVTLVK